MHLSEDRLETYERNGFLIMPELFSMREVEAMKAELNHIQQLGTDLVHADAIAKTICRVHESDGWTASAVFQAAARSPRLLEPAQGLLQDDSLYIYHINCHLKASIDESVWQWRRDYGIWKKDGVPQPNLTTALILLDEPAGANGCLYLIPGSHKEGHLASRFDEATGYGFRNGPKEQVKSTMERGPGPVLITGRPGTVVFFHPSILYATGQSLSRHDNSMAYIVYNQVVNRPIPFPSPRPDDACSTSFESLAVGPDDILAPRRLVMEVRV